MIFIGISSGISGGNIGQGMLSGGLGSLMGSAVNMNSVGSPFVKRFITSAFTGAVSGGLSAGFAGGDVEQGMINGVVGGAIGFALNETTEYIRTRNAERAYMERKLGLSKEQIKYLKKYGLGRVRQSEPIYDDDKGTVKWNELKAGHSKPEAGEWLRTRDIDSKNGIIKAGKLHIRYGSDEMLGGYRILGISPLLKPYELGSYQIRAHYDRFDAVTFPVTHTLLDSVYQMILGVN